MRRSQLKSQPMGTVFQAEGLSGAHKNTNAGKAWCAQGEERLVWLSTVNHRKSNVKGRAENSEEARLTMLCTRVKIISKNHSL